MKFHHGAPDCFTCSQRNGFDVPFTMACFFAGHQGTHHLVGEEE